MLNSIHEVSIIVNSEKVDIYSMEKLNLRINNVVFDPVSIQSKTGEYSFSFELPATPKNNKIFNFANNSSKLNKFNTRYNCEVIANGVNIFTGVLRLTDTQTNNYKCNLVNIKIYNVEDIFGNMVMSDLDWQIDFNGTSTINSVNKLLDSGYYFPLACYGAFQKDPKATYNGEINEYTDLLTIDCYNKWYWESFHPSLSLLETVKRLFRQKGYTVTGDIFNDKAMKMIYMSEYIDSSQDPAYNLNKSEIGELYVSGTFSNSGNLNGSTSTTSTSMRGNGTRVTGAYSDLTFPVEEVYDDTYQWDRICWYDIFGVRGDSATHQYITAPTNNYIYRQNSPSNSSGFIYIPADGLYTIELTIPNLTIEDEDTNLKYNKKQKVLENRVWTIEEVETDLPKNFDMMPVEIQLLRNSNETELINTADEKHIMFPHEMDYTKYKKILKTTGTTTTSGKRGGGGSSIFDRPGSATYIPDEIYYTKKNNTIAYDPYANPNFICGFTTLNNSPAVIKNGASWNASVSDYNQSHYRSNGYILRNKEGVETQTDYNKNTLQCPNSDYHHGYITSDGTYRVRFSYELKITPYTNKTDQYINKQNMYYLPTQEVKNNSWGEKLKLGNFLNNKEKVSDFINNFIKTFNLEYIQDGNNIILNKTKKNILPLNYVDIDDRVNTDNVTFNRIDYPNTMQVKWAIDEEEAGAYRSIDTVGHQSADNWKDYIDRGSDKIIMDTTNETLDSSIESKFSYTWYENFTYMDFNRDTFVENGHIANMRLPLISKDENFIIQNDDAMKQDGLSLKQRLWFRDKPTQEKFRMWNGDEVEISIPTDTYWDFVINFKKQTGSMLDKFFNIIPMVDGNFVTVECYITPFEYVELKNGAMVKFDTDLYVVSEISGYDPTGNNLTTLKLIKVVN